ncbi:SMR family transporter [Jannaschia faecimaris]
MMHWLYLILAIAFETIGTTALKTSEGFTRLWPSLLTLACFFSALFLLSMVLKTLPVGVTYAIWSGLGIVLIATIGWIAFGQKLDLPAILGMALIVTGIVVMQVFSNSTGH